MNNTGLNFEELQDLAYCSFRYALGRKTYITFTISNLLIKMYKQKLLSNRTRIGIIKELKDAINKNQAGMEIDKEQWLNLLKELEH